MGVEGQIWGPCPQSEIFIFFLWYLSRGWGRNLSYGNHSNGGPLWRLKFKKIRFFSRKLSSKFFWGWALCRVRPLRGLLSPTWPLEILVLGTLIKMVFVRGRSPPIWGRYGVWPVCTLAHFFSKSARQILPSIDSENLNKIVGAWFEQISLKVGKKREKSLFGVLEAKIAATMG